MTEALLVLAWLAAVAVGYAAGRGVVWLWAGMRKAPADGVADADLVKTYSVRDSN